MTHTGYLGARSAEPPMPPARDPLDRFGVRVRRSGDAATLGAVVVSAVVVDWGVRSGFNGVAGALLFAVIAISLALSGRVKGREALGVLGLAPLFAVWLAIRTSPWLLPFDVLAALSLLAVSSYSSAGNSIFRMSVPRLTMRALALCAHVVAAPVFILRPVAGLLPRAPGRLGPVLLGLALIAPVILVLGILLASADPVFASLFDLDIDLDFENVMVHLTLLILGAWFVATLLRISSAGEPMVPPRGTMGLGAVEAIVGLGSVVVLYAVFVLTQAVVWLGGANHVLRTSGLTYAEHAREGFFQLLAVGVLTLGLLMALRGSIRLETAAHRRAWKLCAEFAIVLTLAIVAVALHRLAMYEHAYGLTMLRLYSTVFACLIGVVFVLLGTSIAVDDKSHWFLGAAASASLVVLMFLNVVNPEQLVVERNAERLATSTVPFDSEYADHLSDDAVPALRSALRLLDEKSRLEVLDGICSLPRPVNESGWTHANRSKSTASGIRKELCAGRTVNRVDWPG